jgi:hypothetical protein
MPFRRVPARPGSVRARLSGITSAAAANPSVTPVVVTVSRSGSSLISQETANATALIPAATRNTVSSEWAKACTYPARIVGGQPVELRGAQRAEAWRPGLLRAGRQGADQLVRQPV